MSLVEKLMELLPELTLADFAPMGTIKLFNDTDGFGDYIYEWNYTKPIPTGFKVGK